MTFRFAKSRVVARLLPSSALLLLGCGPSFDPPSELHSLRVLGVEKDRPYAQPGDVVNLQMLWQDASPTRGRKVHIAWTPPCFDPAGDLYYACFADPSVFAGTFTYDQETASFTVPQDIVSRRPAPTRSNNAAYGITYVFFALCAGEFTPLPRTSETSFPVGCKDADGKLLGADDFVAGYTAVYSFENFSNHNPVISGFRFDRHEIAAASSNNAGAGGATGDEAGAGDGGANGSATDAASGFCVGASCRAWAGANPPADVDCDASPAQCVATCADDGDSSCPAYPFRPIIDQADPNNQDIDDVSAKLLGRKVGEQMWIDYYTEAGGFKSAVRLLNDATSGWNDNYGTVFYAPKSPGPFRLWAVVHDNRGGVAWSGITLKAQ